MTQEDKELLLIDLSARSPYSMLFWCKYYDTPTKMTFIDTDYLGVEYRINGKFFLHEIKPYLRPTSSMTEEEKRYLMSLKYQPSALKWKNLIISSQEIIDWLNAHYFDYRGLIKKGLAFEAPEGMYNIN